MNVDAFLVAFDERCIATQVCKHSEFNLRVVHRKDYVVLALRDKRCADFFAQVATHGNVLQVRIAARKAARRGTPLDKARVDAARVRIDERREHRDVSALHLLEFAVLDDGEDNRVRRLVAEFFEHDRVGTALLDFGQPERVEKDVAELLGRTDVEFDSRHVANFFFEIFDAVRKLLFERLEGRNVDGDAHGFHLV